MVVICESCTRELEDKVVVKCNAFCSSTFCQGCSRMSDEMLANVNGNQNLLWACNACKDLLKKSRFRCAMTSSNAANEMVIDALKTEIRDYVLGEIKAEIRQNFKTFSEKMPKTPIGPRPPFPNGSSRNKRPREVENEDDGTSHRPSKLLCGTGVCNPESNIIATANQANEANEVKFWLYLSNIHPDVSDEAVTNMVQSNLGTKDATVTKLVPRGRDVSSLTFVSYKVGMAVDLKPKAMSLDTWPSGIRFREFEDTGKKRDFLPPVLLNPIPVSASETPKTGK